MWVRSPEERSDIRERRRSTPGFSALQRQTRMSLRSSGLRNLPYRAVANLRNIFRKIMAGAVFTELLPPRIRREKTLSCRKENCAESDCLQFAARLPHRVNVRRGSFWRTGFKWFTQLGISHRAAPTSFAASPWHTAQVLQSAADFRHEQMARRAMRPKYLRRRNFSQATARWESRSALGLPQRA